MEKFGSCDTAGYVRTTLALTSVKRVRFSNRISQGDLFTPHLSPLPCHTAFLLFSPLGTAGAGWHPRAARAVRVRLQWRLLTCFNNFLPSSANLCKYFSPVSSSLERQLSVCLDLVTDGEWARRQPALVLVVKVLPAKRRWEVLLMRGRRKVWNKKS